MANLLGKEDLRVARTRELIEGAFLELLDESYFKAITVGQITKRAGINRGTFYDHFNDKYSLFDHTIRKTFQEKLLQYGLTSCDFTLENMGDLIAATVDYFVYLNEACPPKERQFRPIAEGQVQMVLYEILYESLETHPERQLTASYLSWAIFGTCLQQIGNGESIEVEQLQTTVNVLTQAVLCSHTSCVDAKMVVLTCQIAN